jgi:threonine 3-dehydrogenase
MTVLLQSGLDILPVITHRFDFRDFVEAFRVMRSGNSGKVILNWEELR